MSCGDCGEDITQRERPAAIPCVRCSKPMHSECAVYSEQEDAFCETCLEDEEAIALHAWNSEAQA